MPAETFSSYVADFGKNSFVALFAEASFEATLEAYSAICGGPAVDVEIGKGEAHGGAIQLVVEVPGSDWTQVLHRIGTWTEFDAKALAMKLGARVVTFEGEDTSACTSGSISTPDGEERKVQTHADADYESALHEEMSEYLEDEGEDPPALEEPDLVDDYDAWFASLGIRTIKVSLTEGGCHAVLAPDEAGAVARLSRIESTS